MRVLHKAGIAVAAAAAALSVLAAPSAIAQEQQAAPSDCPKGYFCGYKSSNFENLGFKYKDCYMQEIPDGMGKGGSWYNNQTPGTRAKMYDKNKKLIYTTPGAPSSDAHGSWAPVWYVDAC
ncbi:hypothetical protein ACSNOK_12515 [Streptomyces sp. URMC 126]|uniref:hypothetical protein n=1 Tax=Streptomyces sp. URMC 126 TaxID=3423401 RepID=UPI003F1B3042